MAPLTDAGRATIPAGTMSSQASFPVRKNPNLPALNAEVLERWQREQTFQRSIDRRRTAQKWVFYEGPPSANGAPGIHHVVGRSLKDLYCRYRTQAGFCVERRAGWDTHGLPVELNVEKALGITKEAIGKTVSVETYNAECRKAVMRFSEQWEQLTERVGYWVDMDHPYVTYDSKYMESVWWLLKRMYEQDLLYRGHTIQPFSPMAGTGLSSHELNQPGAYREVSDLSVIAMFRAAPSNVQQERSQRVGREAKSMPEGPLKTALDSKRLYLLAWTTTPWTLPSNTALAVNPEFDYCLVESLNRYSGERVFVVLAEGLLPTVFASEQSVEAADLQSFEDSLAAVKQPLQDKVPYRILARLPGADLVGLWYEQLLPWVEPAENPQEAFRVIGGDFVSLEDGTGIVHIAPTFGADDARVARQAGVPPMRVADERGELQPLVDQRGRFVPQVGELGGQYVKVAYYDEAGTAVDVDEAIVVQLKRDGQLFRSMKHKHSYPHCWRTDTPILYYPLRSWFVRTTARKSELIELNKTIEWYPESTGTGRFGEWLENLTDWNLSRSRFWGIPLPIWTTEDGRETKCIGSYAELKREIAKAIDRGVMTEDPFADFVPEDFSAQNYSNIDVHRPFIDQVKLVSDSGQVMVREPDVIDVWFDSGAMPYAQVHYPFENRAAIDEREAFPADFIAEGVDQTRGWFFTLHAIATLAFGSVAFKRVLSNGLVLDAQGRKMSKRWGNVIDPVELLDKYGADPIRWYLVTNSPPWLNLRFDVAGVEEVVRKFYLTLWSTYSFFATYANADGFEGSEPAVPIAERPELDRWILSELQVTVQTVLVQLDNFDATRAYRAVNNFVLDSLSNWYVRLNRRRFWKAEMGQDKLAAYQTLYECLLTLSKLIAPVSPFHAEQLYQDLCVKHSEQASVHLTDFPRAKAEWIDDALNVRMRATRRAASLALSLRKEKGIKVRQPLRQLTLVTDAELGAALLPMKQLLCEEVNVKQVEIGTGHSDWIERSAQLDFRAAGPRFGKKTNRLAGLVKALEADQLRSLDAGEPLTLELDGEAVTLTPDLVKLTVRGKSGAELKTDGNLTVLIDTTLTDELRLEGFARELVSAIQRLRKDAGFEVTTRIHLQAELQADLERVLAHHRAYVCAETLCESVELVESLNVPAIEVEGVTLKLEVRAVSD